MVWGGGGKGTRVLSDGWVFRVNPQQWQKVCESDVFSCVSTFFPTEKQTHHWLNNSIANVSATVNQGTCSYICRPQLESCKCKQTSKYEWHLPYTTFTALFSDIFLLELWHKCEQTLQLLFCLPFSAATWWVIGYIQSKLHHHKASTAWTVDQYGYSVPCCIIIPWVNVMIALPVWNFALVQPTMSQLIVPLISDCAFIYWNWVGPIYRQVLWLAIAFRVCLLLHCHLVPSSSLVRASV